MPPLFRHQRPSRICDHQDVPWELERGENRWAPDRFYAMYGPGSPNRKCCKSSRIKVAVCGRGRGNTLFVNGLGRCTVRSCISCYSPFQKIDQQRVFLIPNQGWYKCCQQEAQAWTSWFVESPCSPIPCFNVSILGALRLVFGDSAFEKVLIVAGLTGHMPFSFLVLL